MKTLVVYYSYSGNTKQVVNMIKEKKNFDVLEIKPVNAYSDDYQKVVDDEESKMDMNEILKTEQQRQVNDDWRVVNLYQEGSFYRAYECSAWLYCVCIKEFKVTHRTMKGIDKSVAFIGFPVSSLSKWMPENVIVRQVADKHLTLVLPDSMQTELNSTDEYQKAFTEWKSSIPVITKDKNEARDEREVAKRNSPSLFGIMQQIMSFPVESK